MNQFVFSLTYVNSQRRDHVRCTAPTVELAFKAATQIYTPDQYTISPEPVSIHPPHYIYGEIDASDMTD